MDGFLEDRSAAEGGRVLTLPDLELAFQDIWDKIGPSPNMPILNWVAVLVAGGQWAGIFGEVQEYADRTFRVGVLNKRGTTEGYRAYMIDKQIHLVRELQLEGDWSHIYADVQRHHADHLASDPDAGAGI